MAEQSSSSQTVLVAVNSCDHSQHAFDWYMKNLHKKENHVILFFCQSPLEEPADPYSSSSLYSHDWEKKKRKHAEIQQELIKLYSPKCEEYKLPAQIKIECHNRPGEHICAFAHEKDCTYIVIGKRELGTIRRTLLGGVSNHVVNHAKMPVVVVPARH